MRCKSLLTAFAVTIGLLCLYATPSFAEDDLGIHAQISQYGPYRYRIYQYPSRVTSFSMYPHSYVTFDAVNGNYWEIESTRWNYQLLPESGWMGVFPTFSHYHTLRPEKLNVHFYTPDMKLLGSFDDIRPNIRYSIPRDGNDYERIVVKVECNSHTNQELKMLIWDTVDPVQAQPIPSEVYRH